MCRRKKASGGQAIVMVTIALMSMAGMMGFAVDLGWSYFVQKQAQAAADGAALGAAQEAITRIGTSNNVSGFTCTSAGTGAGQVDCEPSIVDCTSVVSTSNLKNGCLYAKSNGFDHATNSRQIVTMQASDGADVNRPPGVNRISYWARARVIQTIPQLFSFVAGNQQGTVAANATAGIVGVITPGSFYGMNHAGDCLTGNDAGNCGLDFLTGHGKGKGSGGSQACGTTTADLCAPRGAILASSCSGGNGEAGCDQAAGVENGAGLAATSVVIMGPAGAVDGTVKDMNGNTLTPSHSTNAATFQDPTAPKSQPPLQTNGASIGSCGIPRAAGSTAAVIPGNVTLGPYLYYSYSTMAGGKPVPDGAPINITGTTTFSQGAGTAGDTAACPSITAVTSSGSSQSTFAVAGNQTNHNFPTYMFVGGLVNSGTMNIGPGQYVMAGTNNDGNDSKNPGFVFDNEGAVVGTSVAAQATGSMFIFTDAAYPGMSLESQNVVGGVSAFKPLVEGTTGQALYQGTVNMNGSLEMYGLVDSTVGGNLPASMNTYAGVVWWQDRRNSTVGYNEAAGSPDCSSAGVTCTGDNGSVISCGIGCTYGNSSTTNVLGSTNHVTPNSPSGVQIGNGNTKIALNGVYYQPRGAWTHIGNGNTGFNCPASSGNCPLQFITGAVIMESGNTRVVLAGPTNPLITYKAALIQ